MHSHSRAEAHDTSGAPATAAWIAELYGRVLKVDGIDESGDFFVLGGTSLSAMELLDTIAEETGIQIPVRSFYRATGVADLARELDARGTDSTTGA